MIPGYPLSDYNIKDGAVVIVTSRQEDIDLRERHERLSVAKLVTIVFEVPM